MTEPKQALLVIDVQNDFCPGGTLAVPHGDEVIAPLIKLTTSFSSAARLSTRVATGIHQQRNTSRPTAAHGPCTACKTHEGAEFHPALRDDPRITVNSKGLGDTDCYSASTKRILPINYTSKTSKEVVVGV
jgi:nicotinamidase/pyrazinamidase